MTHGLSTAWLISLACSGTKLSHFLCHFDSRPFARVLNYSAERNNNVSNVSRQRDTPKEKESSRGRRVRMNPSVQTGHKMDSVTVQREWSSNGTTSGHSMGQDTPPQQPPGPLTLPQQETSALRVRKAAWTASL